MNPHKMNTTNETLNTLTSSIGMILSYIGFFFLVLLSTNESDYLKVISCIIYGITLIMLHTASTLHHSRALYNKINKKFLNFDLSCIYLLIAGTYTPVILVCLYNYIGISIVSIIWGLAIIGIIMVISDYKPFNNFDLYLYLFMGWFALIGINQLIDVMNINAIILIFIGGIFFTIGTFFLKQKNSRYGHAIWHLFVIMGCSCHYFVIILYVIPYK